MITKDCIDCAGFWNCPKAARLFKESQEIMPGKSSRANGERRAYMLEQVKGCEGFRRVWHRASILTPPLNEAAAAEA